MQNHDLLQMQDERTRWEELLRGIRLKFSFLAEQKLGICKIQSMPQLQVHHRKKWRLQPHDMLCVNMLILMVLAVREGVQIWPL